ncbi:MAG: hypothetical protein IPO83_11810 [Chitinophagaceae bacterium]|nr:hypothetical protein [Chitinophagaceae bacterium]
MRKIKFKTEYVPLSDDTINRHKNFDLLLSAYVTAPKPNWFKQFIQKKWTMFGGGLISGAIITSLFWYNQDVVTMHEPIVEQIKNETTIQDKLENRPEAEERLSFNKDITADVESDDKIKESKKVEPSATSVAVDNKTGAAKSIAFNKSPVVAKEVTHDSVQENQKKNGSDEANKSLSAKNETTAAAEIVGLATLPVAEPTEGKVQQEEQEAAREAVVSSISTDVTEEKIVSAETPTTTTDAERSENNLNIVEPAGVITDEQFLPANSDVQKSEQDSKSALPEIVGGAALLAAPDFSPATSVAKQKNSKEDAPSKKNSEKDSTSNAFLGISLFHRDSTKHETSDETKKGWFVFGKDSAKQNETHAATTDSAHSKISADELSHDSLYIKRYAQVSFITPLSSNGIDGYKYMHYFSLNVLQGYNGALEGAEFGGLLNGLKGYAIGAQFGGLANYVGGNLTGAQFGGLANYVGGYAKGAQFGGLVNVSESLEGAAFAGITNISRTYVNGLQTAGIVNIAVDSLNGAQIAGIVNMQSSDKKSNSWQIAGIGNVSLAKTKGGQIGGVFNLANQLTGGQIGLINLGKKVNGFQIGLINISDTINGAAIGLISVSSDGIFDVDVWSSDFLTFNGGIRVGTRNIYNIYAYGVSPFNDELPFGFGVGIGGHIPLKKFFVDIDGMAWSMHRSYVSFSRVNMINTLRVMGGFTINKYLSVFAGPTFNVSVQDNRYDPFLPNYFYENVSDNTTVRLAPGFVAGIRIF